MCYKVQQKRGIYEVNFGYKVKMEVYVNLSSDIPKLNELPEPTYGDKPYLYHTLKGGVME